MVKIQKLPKRPMVEKGWGGINHEGKQIGEIFVYHEAPTAEAYFSGPERHGSNFIKGSLDGLPVETVKILAVAKGKKGSLHLHLEKSEIFFSLSNFEILTINEGIEESIHLKPYETILLRPGAIHQIIGLDEQSLLIEISTLDKSEDSIRIKKGD